MIDKFKVFELKYDTYMSASKKASEIGHENKSKRLRDWALLSGSKNSNATAKSLGIFNFDANQYVNEKDTKRLRVESPLFLQTNQGRGWELKKEGPIEAYIPFICIDNSIYSEKEDFDFIAIMINGVYIENSKIVTIETDYSNNIDVPFVLYVPIKWDDGFFTIKSDEAIEIESFTRTQPVLFSDRKSAVKLKNIVVNLKEYYPSEYDTLRSFFIDNSDVENFELLWKKIKGLSVNLLYND